MAGQARWGRAAVLVLALLLLLGLPPLLALPGKAASGLTILLVIALLWISEALPLTITALLVPLLATLLGVFSLPQALAPFANPIIFLFLGGFALAAALHRQQLDLLLARQLLRLAAGRLAAAALLLFAATAALSMWISNTATAAMMMPLAIGLGGSQPQSSSLRPFLLLGVAWSANIGGLGTIIGSPPNAIAAAQLQLSFSDWLWFGLPLVALLLPLAIAVLYFCLRPQLRQRVAVPPATAPLNGSQRLTLLIFATTVALWLASRPLSAWLALAEMDTLIALLALLAIALCRLASWPEIQRQTEWGVLLLFGGGLCLSAVLQHSGASQYLAAQLGGWLAQAPSGLMLLLLCAFVVLLTELVSNTAVAALLIPLLLALATPLGLPAPLLVVLVALGASCAFMLPVATPPNAIAFASGEISQPQMMRCGGWLNLLCILLLTAAAWLYLQWWG